VTAPATVTQLAGWDVAELRGGVGRLVQAADRLPPWRARLDAVGRRLGTAECWSGPAGEVAAAAVVELSTVASAVAGALAESLPDLQGLTAAAAEAQERAAGALAAAGTAGVTLDDAGRPVGVPATPTPAMAADQAADVLAVRQTAHLAAARAEEALQAARRALVCAEEAQQPWARVGVRPGGPVGFDGLAAALPAPALPPLPLRRDPARAAAWWTALTATEQLAEIAARPGVVGALDGLPGWARDRANRLQLATALRDLPAGDRRATAEAVAVGLADQELAGRSAQLLQFDPAAGLVAVALGDLDTAAAVGVLVPGINTTPDDDLAGLLGEAAAVGSAAGQAAPGLAVATVAWLGYRTPGVLGAVRLSAARRAGPALDRTLDGLAATRTTPGAPGQPRVTVVGHSYGTVVTGQAARAPGRLAADAVVLLGSPGTSAGRADRLEAAEVYGAWSAADPISTSDFYGPSPYDPRFGDVPLPVELTEGHTDYYDPDRPTLAAVGEVVAGVSGAG
jgi:hypothetical protein